MGCRKLDTDFCNVLEVIYLEKKGYGEKKRINYYPFGLEHKGYNNVVNGTENNHFNFNGKELNKELGLEWLDFSWRNYDASIGRWMNVDPHSESYYTLSPYNSFANNPISFVDPDGRDLLFWQKNRVNDEWEQVKFSDLSEDAQKAIEAFAKTDEGFNLLANFANEGDKIGEVEFTETGKYATHEFSIGEFNDPGYRRGSADTKNKENDNKITIELEFNIAYKNYYKEEGINHNTALAVTIGHEGLIHLKQYIYDVIEAYDKGDFNEVKRLLRKQFENKKNNTNHKDYINGSSNMEPMYNFISQLKNILNPSQVQKAIQDHDKTYHKYRN